MPFPSMLTDLLKIKHPILSAPMAGISGGALARAVSLAGGFGFIGVGYEDTDWLKKELRHVKNISFGLGFITWQLTEKPHLLRLALELEEKPTAIMLSFGDPKAFIEPIKEAGIKVICQVQNLKDAQIVASYGADLIVAQGSEAGGHGGARGTFALVPSVVDAVSPIPVVAAGGIADGRGLVAAFALGAQGVLLGTRFYASEESLGHSEAKRLIIDNIADQTLRTSIFDEIRHLNWPKSFTARALKNKLTELERSEITAENYQIACKKGDFSIAGLFAGEGMDLIQEILPAQVIIKNIMLEAEKTIMKFCVK